MPSAPPCLPPREVTRPGEMPDAGHLFELFQQWTPDEATRARILVGNPAKLYGFTN